VYKSSGVFRTVKGGIQGLNCGSGATLTSERGAVCVEGKSGEEVSPPYLTRGSGESS